MSYNHKSPSEVINMTWKKEKKKKKMHKKKQKQK